MFTVFRLKSCEQRRSELFAKQGRGQQFASVDERDAWIRRVSCHYRGIGYSANILRGGSL